MKLPSNFIGANATHVEIPHTSFVGRGQCYNVETGFHDLASAKGQTEVTCDKLCRANNDLGGLRGFSFHALNGVCVCLYDDGKSPLDSRRECPTYFDAGCYVKDAASGPIDSLGRKTGYFCYSYNPFPAEPIGSHLSIG